MSTFVAQGLLQTASVAVKMEHKYRVSDLILIAEQCGAMKSGKKAHIIQSIVEHMSKDQAAALVSDIRAYSVTDNGQGIVDRYIKACSQERESMEHSAIQCLLRGDIDGAGSVVARYEASQVFARGMGIDWSCGMTRDSIEVARIIMSYGYEDLDISLENRRQIAARIAMLEFLGLSPKEARRSLLEVTGATSFPCPTLVNYLHKRQTCEYTSCHDWDNPKDLAELYAHAYLFKASNSVDLAQLLSERSGNGIEIDCIDNCGICKRGKHRFRWNDLDTIPQLPHHWGCRCSYQAWTGL